jgi:hypothetical protein
VYFGLYPSNLKALKSYNPLTIWVEMVEEEAMVAEAAVVEDTLEERVAMERRVTPPRKLRRRLNLLPTSKAKHTNPHMLQ